MRKFTIASFFSLGWGYAILAGEFWQNGNHASGAIMAVSAAFLEVCAVTLLWLRGQGNG